MYLKIFNPPKIWDLRGGPLDILGGGVSDPKKKFMQEIELEKKFLHALDERKKIRATSWDRLKVRIFVEHMYTFINK